MGNVEPAASATYHGNFISGGRAHLGSNIADKITINYNSAPTDEERSCLHAFLSYEAQKDTNPCRESNTCKWFLQHPRFLDWRDNSTSTLLWVTADPGCGKSVLSKALVDERLLESEPDSTTICYFFFKDISDDQRSVTKALTTLLYQLFSSDKTAALVKHALPDFNKLGGGVVNSFEALWNIIDKVAADPKRGNVVFLLDALDECEVSARRELIKRLKRFDRSNSSTSTTLKILVTSRPYWEIEREFTDLIRDVPSIELRGEEESESIREEIDDVIKSRISRMKFAGSKAKPLLLKRMLEVDNRTYLWVHLVLDILQKAPRVDSQTVLNVVINTPQPVHLAYDAILDKSSNLELSRRLLHIVLAASRPLSLKEMEIALFIQEDMHAHDDLELQTEAEFKIAVRDLCGLFLTIVGDKIFLIHQSAKEFLISNSDCQRPASSKWKFSFNPAESNRILARTCITYLLFSEFETLAIPFEHINLPKSQHTLDGYPLLLYAAINWPDHLRRSEIEIQTKLLDAILRLCDTASKGFEIWYNVHWRDTPHFLPRRPTKLTVASYLGIPVLVEALLQFTKEIDVKDDKGRAPLSWAIAEHHYDVAKLLLENGAKVNTKDMFGETPFSIAADQDCTTIMIILLENGAEIDIKDTSDRTPLSRAVERGSTLTINILLENGAKIDILDAFDQTPLLRAIERGSTTTIDLLLENGVKKGITDTFGKTVLLGAIERGSLIAIDLLLKTDINIPDNNGETPLYWVTELGNVEAVKLLLEKGAKVDVEVGSKPPLLCAAKSGFHTIVKLLLENGANVENKDGYGRTALMCAARSENPALVKLLLENEANVNAQDKEGKTALLLAVEQDDEAVVKVLLGNGAEVDIRDKTGRTAISYVATKGNLPVAKLLLEKGADVNAQDKERITPFLRAVEQGRDAVAKFLLAKFLLENGSRAKIEDKSGSMPLD